MSDWKTLSDFANYEFGIQKRPGRYKVTELNESPANRIEQATQPASRDAGAVDAWERVWTAAMEASPATQHDDAKWLRLLTAVFDYGHIQRAATLTQPQGGEVVAWQYRSCCGFGTPMGEWSEWKTAVGQDETIARSEAESRPDLYEVRPLYSRPHDSREAGTCIWRQQDHDGDCYSTGCGHEFMVLDGPPEWPHCVYCAKPMKAEPWADDDESESDAAIAARGQGEG